MYATREAWLQDAAGELAPIIAATGAILPAAIRVACGFPSTFRRSGALGETFSPADSADKTVEVLIAPTISAPREVLSVLLRQLCLAAASGKALDAVFATLGMEPGKPAALPRYASDATTDALNAIVDALGAYPHAELSLADRPKAATRLLKGLCPSCGYTIRLTKKWADQGMPTCPNEGDTFNLETEA